MHRITCSRVRMRLKVFEDYPRKEGRPVLAEGYWGKCPECHGTIVDAGEELACTSCGIVSSKEVRETRKGGPPRAIDFTGQALGGYLGTPESAGRSGSHRRISDSPSSFRYLKLISDYADREDSTVYSCAKMVERVCDRLSIPRSVMGDAVVISKKVLARGGRGRSHPTAAVSAFAIITACRMGGVTSVGVREVVNAHKELGRKVRTSQLLRLATDSPVAMPPRVPEDYLTRVVARLNSNARLLRGLRSASLNASLHFNRLRDTARLVIGLLDGPTRSGRSPCAMAATSVYAAEVILAKAEGRRMTLSQRDLAETVGVAEYTVREQYRDIFRPVVPLVASRLQQNPVLPPSS